MIWTWGDLKLEAQASGPRDSNPELSSWLCWFLNCPAGKMSLLTLLPISWSVEGRGALSHNENPFLGGSCHRRMPPRCWSAGGWEEGCNSSCRAPTELPDSLPLSSLSGSQRSAFLPLLWREGRSAENCGILGVLHSWEKYTAIQVRLEEGRSSS